MSMVPVFVLPIYAVAFMWIVLDVKLAEISPKRRSAALLLLLAAVIGNVAFYLALGRPLYARFYFPLVHLPVIALFSIVSRYRGWRVIFAFLSAFVSCAIPPIVESLIRLFHPTGFWDDLIVYITVCSAVLLFAQKVFRGAFSYMLRYGENRDFAKFCVIPLSYTIYTFFQAGYTFALPTSAFTFGIKLLPFMFTLFSYYLLLYIFQSTREKQVLKNEQASTAARLAAAEQKLEEMRTVTEQTAAYRHDMRHHLSLIGSYLADGKTALIAEYLGKVGKDLDAITPQKFCENETANLILSSLAAKAKRMGVALSVNARIPQPHSIADTDLCALLSNLLENAITAAAKIGDGRIKSVRVEAKTDEARLLLLIENPYSGEVQMENGLPTTRQEGHGFGVKSVEAIIQKRGGMSLYEAKDGLFTARIVV